MNSSEAAVAAPPVLPGTVLDPLDFPTWDRQRMELKMLQMYAGHLFAARERSAAMVQIPREITPRGPVLVPVPVFESSFTLGPSTFPVSPALNEKISLVAGPGKSDVLLLAADAIVVSAPGTLATGGMGLYGRVHHYGGPVVTSACVARAPIGIGDVIITPGGSLPCKHVVHAAAPRHTRDLAALGPTVSSSLSAACTAGARTIAFTCLGSSADGTITEPIAVGTLLKATREWMEASPERAASVDRILFVAHSPRQHDAFEKLLAIVFPIE